METLNGSGIIGIHSYPDQTGIFLVMPTKYIDLKEGFYSFAFSKSLYTNFNPQILINAHSHITHEDFGKIVNQPVAGMGIAGLMTSPIWGFKEHNGGLFY